MKTDIQKKTDNKELTELEKNALEKFDNNRIINAIWKAAKAIGGKNKKIAKNLSNQVINELEKRFGKDGVPTVEEIQDLVEKALIENGHARTAKAYIIYRKQHQDLRELASLLGSSDLVDQYLDCVYKDFEFTNHSEKKK